MPATPPIKRHPYDQWSPDARALDLVGDKWTLLIVRDLMAGPRRFVELQRVLPGISTEQLRSRLNRMVADGLLTRQRYREVPPRVDYELTDRSRALAPVLGELARWGYDFAWGHPREGEAIDVGAIFRCSPSLVGATGAHGTVELRVGDRSYVFTAADGTATLSEDRPSSTDAVLSGSVDTWIAALAPESGPHDLDLDGDSALGDTVLAGIRAASTSRVTA